jgi:hypothetical protein
MWGLDSVVGLTAWFLSCISVWHVHQQAEVEAAVAAALVGEVVAVAAATAVMVVALVAAAEMQGQ